jgi:hypothetical protein
MAGLGRDRGGNARNWRSIGGAEAPRNILRASGTPVAAKLRRVDKAIVFYLTLVIVAAPFRVGVTVLSNYLIFLLSFPAIALYLSASQSKDRLELLILAWGLLFSVVFVCILWLNTPAQLEVKDVIEPVKPLAYAALVICGLRLGPRLREDSLLKYCLCLAVGMVTFSGLVVVGRLEPFVELFKGALREESPANFSRASGSLAFADLFGVWLAFASLLALGAVESGAIRRLAGLVTQVVVVAGLLFSGSRTGVVVWGAGLVCFSVISGRWRGIVYAVVLSLAVGSVSVGLLGWAGVVGAQHLIQPFEVPLVETSFGHRLNELRLLWEQLRVGHFWGRGPNNALIGEMVGDVESAYFFYGYKFGVFGLAYYASLVAATVWIVARSSRMWVIRVVPSCFGIWGTVALVLGGIAIAVTDEYKSFLMFFILLGLSLSRVRRFTLGEAIAPSVACKRRAPSRRPLLPM